MKTPRILTTTIALLLTARAFAVTDTWDGGGANDNLNTALNWVDNTAPLSDLVNTDLIFGGVARLTPNVSVVFSTNSIIFNNTAGAFTIGGTTLSVGTTGITNNDADTQTFTNIASFGGVANSTINASSGGLTFNNSLTLPAGTLTVDGAFTTSFRSLSGFGTVNKLGAGVMTWTPPASTQNLDLIIGAGTVNTGADGSADTLSSTASIAVNGTSTLNLNENTTLDGALLTRATGATLTLAAGKTLTVQNGGDVTITGAFTQNAANTVVVTGAGSTFTTTSSLALSNGSVTNILAAGSVSTGGTGISIGTSGNGTVTVDGSGSSFGGGTLTVGQSGATGSLTFSNGSTGAFSSIGVDALATAGSSGTLLIQSGASITGTSVTLANSAFASTGTVTINGADSALTLVGGTTIGATSASTGTLNVQSGGTFHSSTAGAITVNATGTVAITGGTFNANGNMTLNGQMTRDAAGAFTLASGKTLTIQNGGDFTNTTNYSHTTASTVTVTGAGSVLSASGVSQLLFSGGSTLNVLAGAMATAGGSIFLVGNTSNATALVDGAGSLLTSTLGGLSVATNGNTATLTFSNGAAGNSTTALIVGGSNTPGTNGTVHILSGADVTAGSLRVASVGGVTTSGTVRVDGAGSTLAVSSVTTIGNVNGAGTVEVENGGLFSTSASATVNPSGTIALAGATMNFGANLNVAGGQLTSASDSNFNASNFNQTAGVLTVSSGGDASFASTATTFGTTSAVVVTGADSTLTMAGTLTFSNSAVSVLAGGALSATFFIDIGGSNASTTVLVDGEGSTLATGTRSFWGEGSGTSSITFSNNAIGNLSETILAEGNGNNTTLNVASGADVTTTGLFLANFTTATAAGSVNVGGAGSTLTVTSTGLFVGGSSGSTATLNITPGGAVALTSGGSNFLVLNPTGTVNLNGGSLTLSNPITRNGGVLNFNTGLLSLQESLTIGATGLLGQNLTLAANRQLILGTGHTATVDAFQTLTLDGGSLSTGALANNGTIDFKKGSLAITGGSGFSIGTGALGANVTLGTGANLAVTNTTTVNAGALLRVDGGSFSGAGIMNSGTIDHRDGLLNFTGTLNNAAGSRLFVGGLAWTGGNINNAGRITLQNGIGEIGGAGALTNTGVVTGDGTLSRAVTNSAGGQIRAEPGKTLTFTGTLAANSGTLSLEGGTLDFTTAITNAAAGFISGRGALHTVGVTNNGVMAFSGGYADVFGDVTNASGARIVTSGASSTTTFFDDVAHNGVEIFTGTNASTVFFGSQSGSGPLTGTGTVYFVGDLRPGSSPGAVSISPQAVFAPSTTLVVEIGGTTAGTQHDKITFSSAATPQVAWDGTLAVTLINGFTPAAGQTFNILDFDAARDVGAFENITLPALSAGLFWRTDLLYVDGTIQVSSVPGTYAEWQAHFGTGAFDADDDHDGISNGIEFLLGTNPKLNASPGQAPLLELPPVNAGNVTARVTFTIPKLPATDAHYRLKASDDLKTWTLIASKDGIGPWTGSANVTSNPPVGGFAPVTVAETLPANTTRRYHRLEAEAP